jgi:hypothetical protein
MARGVSLLPRRGGCDRGGCGIPYKSFNTRDWDAFNGRSLDFVRDTIFGGNEEAYRAAEGVSATACALAGPVAEGTQAGPRRCGADSPSAAPCSRLRAQEDKASLVLRT